MNNVGENADGSTHKYSEAVAILENKGYNIICCGVGHYEGLVDDTFEITGLAYNTVNHLQDGMYSTTVGQTFGDYGKNYQRVQGKTYSTEAFSIVYTVDEYEAMFNEYVASINQELADAQQALIDARSELSQLQTNGGITAEELLAIANAQAEYDDARANIFIATNELADAEEKLNEYQAIIDEKQQALDLANANLAEKC